ncbi:MULTISPECIES: glycosyltransferase [unclassified Microbacterium]|uniref:glycosyltransferase n=1 Tax=unclassified Microbacterium TaxID=2609290 RepID=UPI003018C9A3
MLSPLPSASARVSIIIPVYNDEDWVAAAIESCMRQTVTEIEIICVDDASTDRTREIIDQYRNVDPRIRLIAHDRNRSAFQCRRQGVVAATAPYVLFLDGDDELAPYAVEKVLRKAATSDADLVGFGVDVIANDGGSGGPFQKRLQPTHEQLDGEEIITGLFPVGTPARGQIWRYLFATSLLRIAYAQLPEDLELYRANDLPIAYLAISAAQRYVSIPTRLYRYYFGRGSSGQRIEDPAQFSFYLSAVDSIDSIAPAIRDRARKHPDPDHLIDAYASARLSVIGNLLNYLLGAAEGELRKECLELLQARVSEEDIVLAATGFCPAAIPFLAKEGGRVELGARPVRSVLLTTRTLTTGGVSGVVLSQAHYLMDAGYEVTIAARRPGSSLDAVPRGAKFVEVKPGGLLSQAMQWSEICRRESIDVVIDHQILYSRDWPVYALVARALGAPTIGWIHNFAGRPIYDLNDLTSLMTSHLGALAELVTLSPLDVAFWKLRGIPHVSYLPNPASPMILEAPIDDIEKPAPTGRAINLLWWGRLEQHTKQVRQLVLVAAELQKMGIDFQLDIIGPGWQGMTPQMLEAEAHQRGLAGHVRVRGPLYGDDLISAIDAADIFVNTSVIEGYPLTILEAQARGLPVVMYELPWLALAEGNGGIVTVPQTASAALARAVVAISESPERYTELSRASLEAAQRTREFDFAQVYRDLVGGELSAEFSPDPTIADAKKLIDLLVFFAERHAGTRAGDTKAAAAPKKPAASRQSTAKAPVAPTPAGSGPTPARAKARVAASAAQPPVDAEAAARIRAKQRMQARAAAAVQEQESADAEAAVRARARARKARAAAAAAAAADSAMQARARAKRRAKARAAASAADSDPAPPARRSAPDSSQGRPHVIARGMRPIGRLVLIVVPALRPTVHKYRTRRSSM